jgi:hypothetical protein
MRRTQPQRALRWSAALALLAVRVVAGQSSYYNLDSGRPTRVEDAIPTPRGELEIQFLPVRAEWVGDGTQRLRYEPKLAFGILPMTEIEARVPFVQVHSPGSPIVVGVASAGLGALHAFNVETKWPALAVAGEVVLPIGSLSAPMASYSLKVLLTKTFTFGRLQVNAGGGTWSVRATPTAVPQGYTCGNAPGVPPCLIPDVPCDLIPVAPDGARSTACAPALAAPNELRAAGSSTRSTGAHWTAALGFDHAFPLQSTLVMADVIVDRFVGLYPLDDWTAELGLRRQITPQLVLDLGVGRRFAGTTQGTDATLGITFDLPWR